MKTLLYFSAATGLLLSLIAAEAGNPSIYRSFVAADAIQSDLLGPVRSVHKKTADVEKKDSLKATRENETLYDPSGYLLESRDIDLETGETESTKRTYDEAGNLVSEEERKGTEAIKKRVRMMPERKRVIWESTGPSGLKITLAEMTFDRFGKEGEGRDYDAQGKLESQSRMRRDAQGRETEVVFSDAQGKPTDILKLTWDNRGFPTSEEHESKAVKFTAKITNEYPEVDQHGNWTKKLSSVEFFENGEKTVASKRVETRTIEYY